MWTYRKNLTWGESPRDPQFFLAHVPMQEDNDNSECKTWQVTKHGFATHFDRGLHSFCNEDNQFDMDTQSNKQITNIREIWNRDLIL